MKKPKAAVIKLYNLGFIHTISVKYRMTGVDTAETYLTIVGDNGKVEGLASTWMPHLDLDLNHNSIAKLRDADSKSMRQWLVYEKENAEEIVEFERLKKKFDAM